MRVKVNTEIDLPTSVAERVAEEVLLLDIIRLQSPHANEESKRNILPALLIVADYWMGDSVEDRIDDLICP